jgi:hypothetical protein
MFSGLGDRRARRGRRLSAALVVTVGALLLPAGLAGIAATPAQALTAPPPPPPPPPDPYAPCLSTGSQDAYGSYFENFYSNVVANDPFSQVDQLLPFCAPDDPPPPDPLPGAADVAFGDSYISGEGARNGFNANAPGGAGCDVSTTAWPSLLHPSDPNFSGPGFENWACTGGLLADATARVNAAVNASQDPSIPFWGVGAGTDLVQISIGGNDLKFPDIVQCAVTQDLTKGLLRSNSYRSRHSDGSLCIPTDDTLANLFAGLTPKLIAFYQLVAQAAPNATIEVAGYPMIFPQDGSHCREGLTRADEQAGNHFTVTMDDYIHQAVDAAGLPGRIRYLDFSTALAHANVCGQHGVNSMLHGTFPLNGLYHPNEIGHRALADAYTRLAVAGFPSPVIADPPPPDGSIIGDVGSDTVWAMAGGAKINVGTQSDLAAAGYANATVSLVPTDLLNSLPTTPRDGTLLRDASTGAVYQITGGSKTPSGATAGGVTVPTGYLADIPDAASASAPAVLGDPTGVRQVFFNAGGQLLTMSTDAAGTWSGPVTLAANITGSPAATGDPGGVMEVFFNSDGQLQHMRYENGAWGAPDALGGPITGNPALVRNAAAGLFEVYFNSGGQLNVVWWAGNQWNGPTVLGGPITGSPAAIASTTTSAREVYLNSGGQLDAMWVDAANSGWNGPAPLGAAITGSPMAMGNPSGARQVFINSGGQLNEMWVDTTATQWNGPLSFGVPITGTPAGLGTPLGPWEVYFNSGGQLNVLWQAGHQWNGPGVIAGSITGSPAAIVKYTNGSREILYPSGPSLATMWITTSNFTGNWTGPAAVYTP